MTHTFTHEEFLFLVHSAVYLQGNAPPKSPLKYIPPAFSFFFFCIYVLLHFLLLFPVSQWKTQRVRPGGEFWFKVEKGATGGGGRANLAGVQQVFAFMITAESTLLLISAVDSFRGTGGRQIWSVSAVKVSLSALGSSAQPSRSQRSQAAAKSALSVPGPQPACKNCAV